MFKDIQLTATNDDQYFVFEDILYQIMLCFSRDTEINHLIQTEFTNSSKAKQYEGPPSGVVPFHGICMYGKDLLLCFWLKFKQCSHPSGTLLLPVWQPCGSILYLPLLLHPILPSTHNGQHPPTRYREFVSAVWEAATNTWATVVVSFEGIADSTVS